MLLPAWVFSTRRASGLGPPCYTPRFPPGSSLLRAAFPAWVLLATRRVSGLGLVRVLLATRCASGLGLTLLDTLRFPSGSGLGRALCTASFRPGLVWVILGTRHASGLGLGVALLYTERFRPDFGPGHSGYTVCFRPDFGPGHNGYTACLRSEHWLGSVAAWCAFGLGLAWVYVVICLASGLRLGGVLLGRTLGKGLVWFCRMAYFVVLVLLLSLFLT